MRKTILVIILCTLSWLLTQADDVIYLNTEQFRERVIDYTKETKWTYYGDKPCVLDFYTTWCGPCRRLAPIMEELSETYCDRVVFYKIDAERELEVAYAFGISSYPTVIYIPVHGVPALTRGLYPQEEIVNIIEEFLLAEKAAPEPEKKQEVDTDPQPPEKKKSLWERWKERRERKKKK